MSIPLSVVRPGASKPRGDKASSSSGGFKIRSLGNLLDDDSIHPRGRLLGNCLLERGLVLLYAPTGIGKSWLSLGIAAAVASRSSFGGFDAPSAQRVLYIDGEMDVSDLKNRFGAIAKSDDAIDSRRLRENVMLFVRHDQSDDTVFPNFSNPDDRERILSVIRKQKPHLVVLDNLSTLSSVSDENAAASWDPLLELLQDIKRTGTAVLVVHHSNKAGSGYRGSSKIGVLFDAIIRLQEDPAAIGFNGAAFLWTFGKARMLDGETKAGISGRFGEGRWSWERQYDSSLHRIVAEVRSRKYTSQKELAAASEMSPGELSKQLRQAMTVGLLSMEERKLCFSEARAHAAAETDGGDFKDEDGGEF